jgi:arsenate reductase
MPKLKIFHNPRCSKSRQTLQLLEEKGLQVEVIEYLKTPPSAAELSNIISMLGFASPRQLMRKSENEYKEQNLQNESLTDAQIITAMCNSPKLIERPIVINGSSAVIGRPPESVLNIL